MWLSVTRMATVLYIFYRKLQIIKNIYLQASGLRIYPLDIFESTVWEHCMKEKVLAFDSNRDRNLHETDLYKIYFLFVE